jgi:hypothetical protein
LLGECAPNSRESPDGKLFGDGSLFWQQRCKEEIPMFRARNKAMWPWPVALVCWRGFALGSLDDGGGGGHAWNPFAYFTRAVDGRRCGAWGPVGRGRRASGSRWRARGARAVGPA